MISVLRGHCAALAFAALLAGPAPAAELPEPAGPVLVTLSGKIAQNNRRPFDAFRDKFFGVYDLHFDRAAAFDLAMLESLGMHTVTVRHDNWDAAHTFEGPLFRDVLAAAGAAGNTVVPMALDGYAAEIPMSDLEKWPVILAVKMDGEYMGIGGAGPAFVVYPRDNYPALRHQDDAKWVWGVYHVSVE